MILEQQLFSLLTFLLKLNFDLKDDVICFTFFKFLVECEYSAQLNRYIILKVSL